MEESLAETEQELHRRLVRSGVAAVGLNAISLPRLLKLLNRVGGTYQILVQCRSGKFEIALGHGHVLGAQGVLKRSNQVARGVQGLRALKGLRGQIQVSASVKAVRFHRLANLFIGLDETLALLGCATDASTSATQQVFAVSEEEALFVVDVEAMDEAGSTESPRTETTEVVRVERQSGVSPRPDATSRRTVPPPVPEDAKSRKRDVA